jgi:hypothetical protein
MKPLKERIDEAALAYNEEEIKNEFNTNSLDAFLDGANCMQSEMQKGIDELVKALEFYVYLKGDLNEVYTATVGLNALTKHKERMR